MDIFILKKWFFYLHPQIFWSPLLEPDPKAGRRGGGGSFFKKRVGNLIVRLGMATSIPKSKTDKRTPGVSERGTAFAWKKQRKHSPAANQRLRGTVEWILLWYIAESILLSIATQQPRPHISKAERPYGRLKSSDSMLDPRDAWSNVSSFSPEMKFGLMTLPKWDEPNCSNPCLRVVIGEIRLPSVELSSSCFTQDAAVAGESWFADGVNNIWEAGKSGNQEDHCGGRRWMCLLNHGLCRRWFCRRCFKAL